MNRDNSILFVGGFGFDWRMYRSIKPRLQKVSGCEVFLTPITTFDWLEVAINDDYSRLLNRLDYAVTEILRKTEVRRLTLVAHSAGGILARIYMGDRPYGRHKLVFNGHRYVNSLITMGTPHTTTRRGRRGGQNQITFAQTHYPGAYWPTVHYASVISKSIFGDKRGLSSKASAWQSYTMLSGVGEQWGDGIVPLSCGMLEGAQNIVLPDLCHMHNSERPWYAQNEAIISSWWTRVDPVKNQHIRRASKTFDQWTCIRGATAIKGVM